MSQTFISLPAPADEADAPEASGALTPLTLVRKLVSQYRLKHHARLLGDTSIGYNTIYVSFDMTSLITALQAMKTTGATGCRIYFGAHDNDEPRQNGFNYKNKMTLIFVGTKVTDGIIEELLSDSEGTKLGYNFGTLCPPECRSCAEADNSVAKYVFGADHCNQP